MSLWTPSGEHPVSDRSGTRRTAGPTGPEPSGEVGDQGAGTPPAPPGPTPPGGVGTDDPSVTVDELRRQLADAPVDVVVANHAYGLFELAAVHLSQAPPNLAQAQMAIDAFGLLVEGLGDRLGEAANPLRDALAQVRLAFVQLGAAEKARQDAGNGTTA